MTIAPRYYIITAPPTPGARPAIIGTSRTLRDARRLARRTWRPDLTGQDVRIDDADGRLVEYAGPAR